MAVRYPKLFKINFKNSGTETLADIKGNEVSVACSWAGN